MGNFLNCPTFPAGQDYQFLAGMFLDDKIPGSSDSGCTLPTCYDIVYAMHDEGRTCARNILELHCLLEEIRENGSKKCNSVEVCTGATIDFGTEEWYYHYLYYYYHPGFEPWLDRRRLGSEWTPVAESGPDGSGRRLDSPTTALPTTTTPPDCGPPPLTTVLPLAPKGAGPDGNTRRLELLGFFSTSFELDVPDKTKIICQTCGTCTLVRPFFSLFYSLCPFFTTQLGNDIEVKGFNFVSGYYIGAPSEKSVIAFNNYGGPTLSGTSNMKREIKVKSEAKLKTCKSGGGSGKGGGKGGCKSSDSSSGKGGSGKGGSGKGGRERRARSSMRRTSDYVAIREKDTFCAGDDFFDDDEEEDEDLLTYEELSDPTAGTESRNGGGTTGECDPGANPMVIFFLQADDDKDGTVSCYEMNKAGLKQVLPDVTCDQVVDAAMASSNCFAETTTAAPADGSGGKPPQQTGLTLAKPQVP